MTSAPGDAEAMSLEHARDALSDSVRQFHNAMLRQGVKEMSPRQWAKEFRLWLDPYSFERDYEETKKWLAKCDAEHEGQHPATRICEVP